MRRLLLIRHAKSSWKHPELSDHDRPLNKRGKHDSKAMAQRLAEKDESLDALYCSTAVRALTFAQQISQECQFELIPEQRFYTFSVGELIENIRSLPDSVERIGVVAHNPAITTATNRLSNSAFANVPTAGIAALNCPLDSWQDLQTASCQLDYFEYPKMFKNGGKQ